MARGRRSSVSGARAYRAPKVTEADIQRALISHVRLRAKPGLYWMHVPNGGERNRITGAILKGQGLRAGAPDLFFFFSSRAYALELKTRKGRVSDVQKSAHHELSLAGIPVIVAHGLDAALAALTGWGLLREDRARG